MKKLIPSLIACTIFHAAVSHELLSEEEHSKEESSVPLIERMPAVPQPFHLIDWKARARGFDSLAFNPDAKGDYLPLFRSVEKPFNISPPGFALPAYVGSPDNEGAQAIATLAAVMSGTLAGCDEGDRVRMCCEWFNTKSHLVLNGPHGQSSGSFWYDLLPAVIFSQLTERYPKNEEFRKRLIALAERWLEACQALGGKDLDFNHTSFDFNTREGRNNGKWREPDAAAGVAYIEYAAWTRSHDLRHLDAARWCMDFLERRTEAEGNPLYEVLLYYAPAMAAKMNVEVGTHYDIGKLMNWCFSENKSKGTARIGWGIIAQRWGEYDCHGLQGSTTDGGGYGFAMNTFHAAGAIAPLARYDPRFARAIGKWLLNVANNARLFYGDALPPDFQSCPAFKSAPPNVVPYEGLRKASSSDPTKSPYASGDPLTYGWPAKTDFAVYGGAHVGYLAALIEPTNEPHILKIDLLATDFLRGNEYPTWLFYNPDAAARNIKLQVGEQLCDIYDSVSHEFILRRVTGEKEIVVPAGLVRVIIVVPSNGTVSRTGTCMKIDGIVIDFHIPN